ncbi:MAG: redoxin domain-containing protein [Lachnospiraceae bacterium]|nr:redoxin domain-containing protein [Lachnospiraceae bacterium]
MKKKVLGLLGIVIAGVLLVGCNSSKPAKQAGTETQNNAPAMEAQASVIGNSYIIEVDDEDGNPVPDVTLKFCTDTQCRLGKTGQDGVAVFETDAPGAYSVHILEAPKGFEEDETEYTTDTNFGLMKLTVKGKAANDATTGKVYNFPTAGLQISSFPAIENLYGTIELADVASVPGLPDVIEARLDYTGRPQAETKAFTEELENCDHSDKAEVERLLAKMDTFYDVTNGPLIFVFGIKDDGSVTFDDVMANENINPQNFITETLELGKAGGYTYYLVKYDYDKFSTMMPVSERPAEAEKDMQGIFSTDLKEVASHITLTGPLKPLSIDNNSVLNFAVTDFDGNKVDLKSLCAGHKVTMLNVWGTWCHFCVEELPQLEELNKEFEAQDCQIVGFCEDGWKNGKAEKAQQQLKDAGVTYVNVIAPENYHDYMVLEAYPTSFFLDSEGRVLTKEPVAGTNVDLYRAALKEALDNLQ